MTIDKVGKAARRDLCDTCFVVTTFIAAGTPGQLCVEQLPTSCKTLSVRAESRCYRTAPNREKRRIVKGPGCYFLKMPTTTRTTVCQSSAVLSSTPNITVNLQHNVNVYPLLYIIISIAVPSQAMIPFSEPTGAGAGRPTFASLGIFQMFTTHSSFIYSVLGALAREGRDYTCILRLQTTVCQIWAETVGWANAGNGVRVFRPRFVPQKCQTHDQTHDNLPITYGLDTFVIAQVSKGNKGSSARVLQKS